MCDNIGKIEGVKRAVSVNVLKPVKLTVETVVSDFVSTGEVDPTKVILGITDTEGEFEEECETHEDAVILKYAVSEGVETDDFEVTPLFVGKFPLAELHCDALKERSEDRVKRGDCDVDNVAIGERDVEVLKLNAAVEEIELVIDEHPVDDIETAGERERAEERETEDVTETD